MLAACQGAHLEQCIAEHEKDSRAGVVSACAAGRIRLTRHKAEIARLDELARFEAEFWSRGLTLIAGVDEVGRGALAGPVTAAACILPRDATLTGLNDSKKLTAATREELDSAIRRAATAIGVAHVCASVIDAIGIAEATVQAMREALALLDVVPEHVVVDGLPVDIGHPMTAVVRGDGRVRVVAAASVVAKVARDALMVDLDEIHPGYGFAANKGYGSSDHLDAIHHLGVSAVHRRSFSPCGQESLF